MTWLMSNLTTIIVGLIVLLMVVLGIRSIRKNRDCGDCGYCSSASLCHNFKKSFVEEYHQDHTK